MFMTTEGLEAILGAKEEKVNSTPNTIDLTQCKNEGIGYTTIIPDSAYNKVTEMFNLFKELRCSLFEQESAVQNKIKYLPKEEKDYALLEYSFFMDSLSECWEKLTDLVAIHELSSKEHIDEALEKDGLTTGDLIKMSIMSSLFELMAK